MLAFGYGPIVVLLPFVAMGVVALGLGVVLPRIDAVVERLTHHREVTPYSALACRRGADPGRLAGAGAARAGPGAGRRHRREPGRGVAGRRGPAGRGGGAPAGPRRAERRAEVPNLAVLLDPAGHRPRGPGARRHRAARGAGHRQARRRRSRRPTSSWSADVAHGAALLLRGVALNAELADRVRRADDLATELQASRQRLARAREVERRRLVMELGNATTDRLAGLRDAVSSGRDGLARAPSRTRRPPSRRWRGPGSGSTSCSTGSG